jgi:hypothetical protein
VAELGPLELYRHTPFLVCLHNLLSHRDRTRFHQQVKMHLQARQYYGPDYGNNGYVRRSFLVRSGGVGSWGSWQG